MLTLYRDKSFTKTIEERDGKSRKIDFEIEKRYNKRKILRRNYEKNQIFRIKLSCFCFTIC